MPEPKRRGRPPVADKKRSNVTFRVRDELRAKLAVAADANGRSFSEEVEYRIERSFWEDGLKGDLRQLVDPQTTSLTVPSAPWPLPHNRAGSNGPI